MFADFDLARRIEAAEATLSTQVAEASAARPTDLPRDVFVRPLAGGVAVFTGADSPITKVIGVGFGGLPDEGALETIESAYRQRGSPVRAEVATLADPAFHAMLTRRGYVLEGFENVLGRRVDSALSVPEVEGVAVGPAGDPSLWNDVVIEGFANPDAGVVSAPGEDFPREVLQRIYDDMAQSDGFARYLARVSGEPAGGASLRVWGGIAQLAGAATLPRFRRRGVQTALLNARLRAAASMGCDIAVVTTQPGSRSQQNAQRRGFELLYTRAVLVKPV